MFWFVVGGIVLIVLLLCARHDYKRRGSVRGVYRNRPIRDDGYASVIQATNIHNGPDVSGGP